MEKLPLITSVFLNVTNACNLACRYCFVEQHPNYMTLDVAKDTVQFLLTNAKETNSIPGITFFGGEPMLCWDSVVKPLIWYIRKELAVPFTLSMTTNGVLLTDDHIEYLNEHDISVMLSIDGTKETQDFNRPFHNGASSFDVLENIILPLLKSNPGMTFRSTLIPETCGHIFENVMFAEQCGYTNFFLIPNVFQTWNSQKRKEAEAAFIVYTDYFIKSFQDGKVPIRCNPLEEGFKRILEVNSAVVENKCRGCKTAYQKCGLGASGFGSVDYRGNIYACQEMVSCKGEGDPFYIGTIYEGTDNTLRLTLIEKFNAERVIGENCSSCKLNRICDGGCVANNYLWSGDVNKVSSVFCWWEKFVLNEAIRIANILGNDKNRCFRNYWVSLHERCGGICQN